MDQVGFLNAQHSEGRVFDPDNMFSWISDSKAFSTTCLTPTSSICVQSTQLSLNCHLSSNQDLLPAPILYLVWLQTVLLGL